MRISPTPRPSSRQTLRRNESLTYNIKFTENRVRMMAKLEKVDRSQDKERG